MAKFVFLDTNNWIYLANGFHIKSNSYNDLHLKIFNLMEKRVDDGSLIFLVNDIILEEFDRNKKHTEEKIHQIERKKDGLINSLKGIKEFLPEEKGKVAILQQSIEAKSLEKINQERAHIAKVENLLKHKTKIIPIADAHKIAATDMAVEKKAPFIGDKKNSMADALILLSSLGYIQQNGNQNLDLSFFGIENDEQDYYSDSYFVSSNSGDFADLTNKELIHPDLEPLLKATNTHFYHNINPLMELLEKKFLTEEEEAAIEQADDWHSCNVCDFEYSRIIFDDGISVFNPYLGVSRDYDPAQLRIFERDKVGELDPMVNLVTGYCNHCNADYIQCPNCLEIVLVDDSEAVISCTGCHYSFQIHKDIDRKGFVHSIEYEIIKSSICSNCGKHAPELSEAGHCEECAEYERIVTE